MSGPGADYSPFSRNLNVCLLLEPADGLTRHAHEETVRLAGLKGATYLAGATVGVEPDEVKEYVRKPITELAGKYP